jgi:hypothetical protein
MEKGTGRTDVTDVRANSPWPPFVRMFFKVCLFFGTDGMDGLYARGAARVVKRVRRLFWRRL